MIGHRHKGDPDPAEAQDALLPVQRISGPIVTVCGGDDTVWPSCAFSSVIVERADGFPLTRTPEGGTVEADATAGNDALTHVVDVLRAA